MTKILLFFFFALNLSAVGQSKKPAIELWHAGFMHANEIKGKTGQMWFGVFQTESGFEVRKTKVTILDSSQAFEDEKYVAVNQPLSPIFLVRGVETLKEGPVKSVFFGSLFLNPEEVVVLDKRNANWCGLVASGKRDGEIIHNYEVKFYDSKIKQPILKRDPTYLEGSPTLEWAGDLDSDGKLDLLMDLRTGYNESQPTLFLSSEAGENELVKKVASYSSIGC